ncbi:MAG: response regulator [Candidatus Didemnitutus sp.]|nr:response regulator [Candidatus Didemnitutus sp.]
MGTHDIWPLWFRQLSVQQDYFWFLSLLGWGIAATLWWWHPRRATTWIWLPWVAGVGVLGAMIQFGIYNQPFDFFHSRLIPGTIENYKPALIEPHVLGDWLHGGLLAAMGAGWGWRAAVQAGAPRWRWVAVVLAGAAASWHLASEAGAGDVLAAWALVTAAALGWRIRGDRRALLALLAAATVPVFATVGPLALLLGEAQRMEPPNPMGLTAALVHTVVAAATVLALLGGVLGSKSLVAGLYLWREWRRPLLFALVWLVVGLGFAHQTGRDNRRELHENRLRTAAARAALFDREVLKLFEQPLPRIEGVEWATRGELLRLPPDSVELTRQITRVLNREQRATPYMKAAHLVVVKEGWLIAVASSRPTQGRETMELLRRATPQDQADWDAARNVIEASPVPEIGQPYFCRAAITAEDERMLGWLEFEQVEFFQSLERKWRSGPLTVTALGLILGATLLFQRRAARDREAALRAAAVHAESNRMKSVFLATVSHELRTPLQSVLGYSDLLRQRLAGDAQAEQWLGAVQQHGELMTRLVNDLIDLGSVEAGTFRLAPRVENPGALAQQVVEGLRHRAEAKGLALTCAIAPGVPAQVLLDGTRWRQVVFNLVGNAVKFTDTGSVAVALTAELLAPAEWRLELRVTDTGPGIPAEARPQLFTAFTRLAHTAHKEGAGLGLALSAAFCRAMGGVLTVRSDGRSGTEFRATVRLSAGHADALPIATKAAAGLAQRHVLVVDDNPLVRELFATILRASDARCTVASNDAEACAALRDGSIDTVILDIALPGESGIELAPKLRAMRAGLHIVGASAHAGAEERSAALAAGMDDFLTKPVAREELLAALALPAAPETTTSLWREALATQFCEELPAVTQRVEQAMRAGEWRQMRAAAHYLANSAAAVGDDELLAACDALAGAAEQQNTTAAQRSWAQCAAELARWRKLT